MIGFDIKRLDLFVHIGMWLNEGGQSATGKLIDHIISTHPAYPTLRRVVKEPADDYSFLANYAERLARDRGVELHSLTRDLHVTPDFHGNRSPLADPNVKGMVCGLTFSKGLDELSVLYIATLQSLVFGTKQIVEAMTEEGKHEVKVVYMCGGLIKNLLFVQMHADILDRMVVVPSETESVLIGSALLGMCSSGESSLADLIQSVSCDGTVYYPNENNKSFYEKKYRVFSDMVQDELKYRKIMNSAQV